ncbi:MAG: phosphonate C-P lyase system protein PhnG [Betaproteobacteria bacterium]|nr:phosphonate C-P lyase system protein PhnG [Betaproteobacteria bacterium]
MHDTPHHPPQQARQDWMRLLATAPLHLLEAWGGEQREGFTWLRRPETGLVMVRGRIGASGNRFNVGEMTLTRCTLRLAGGQHGVAYVQGRSARKAELAALADALLQDVSQHPAVDRDLLQPLRARRAAESAARQQATRRTRVDFLTIARGDE